MLESNRSLCKSCKPLAHSLSPIRHLQYILVGPLDQVFHEAQELQERPSFRAGQACPSVRAGRAVQMDTVRKLNSVGPVDSCRSRIRRRRHRGSRPFRS